MDSATDALQLWLDDSQSSYEKIQGFLREEDEDGFRDYVRDEVLRVGEQDGVVQDVLHHAVDYRELWNTYRAGRGRVGPEAGS